MTSSVPFSQIAGPDPNTKIGPVQIVMDPNWQRKLFERSGLIRRMETTGDEMVSESRSIAPQGATGILIESIYSRVIQGRNVKGQFGDAVLEFGCSVNYALPVEFGHHTTAGGFVPPQPFMRPVAARKRKLG